MGAEMTAMSVLAGVALLGAVALGSPCDTQTEYYCVTVRQDDGRPSGRTLVLDDLRHSYVDLDDPTHLEFWYIRRIVDAIEEFAPTGPLDIVHVGGGAMTVPAHVQATRPDSEQTVFEIDGELVDVVTEDFARRTGPGTGIEVVVGDGRQSLRDLPDDSADVVVGDAFGSRSVPWHLATTEFVEEVDRVLRPGGVYVANVIDGPRQRFLSSYAATIATQFDHVSVVLGESAALGGNGNSVIVASDEELDLDALDRRRVSVGDGGRLVVDIDDFIDGGLVLSDDFAPVDQLLAGTR
jgi:spermidine synthase